MEMAPVSADAFPANCTEQQLSALAVEVTAKTMIVIVNMLMIELVIIELCRGEGVWPWGARSDYFQRKDR